MRFWRYLIGALDGAVTGLAHELAPLLRAPESGANHRLLTALVNRLVNLTTPIILALDDYHLLADSTIHTGVAFLLDHLPQQLQLVISSRSDPPLPLPRRPQPTVGNRAHRIYASTRGKVPAFCASAWG